MQAFLSQVAGEMDRLRQREHQLEQALLEARDAPNVPTQGFDDATATRLLGEEAANILQAARKSAASVKAKAEQGAAAIVSAATDEAARVREEAEHESARRRGDAAADAEAQVSTAKEQGRQMVNEARLYRERVLSELTRRRDEARSHIEQLTRGREHLVKAFTAARDEANKAIERIGAIDDGAAAFDLPPPEMPRGGTDAAVLEHDAERAEPSAAPEPPVIVESVETVESARVVELFPEGAVHGDDSAGDEHGAVDEDAPSSTVESLFAKLRAASVDEPAGAPATGADVDDSDDAIIGDEAGPAAAVVADVAGDDEIEIDDDEEVADDVGADAARDTAVPAAGDDATPFQRRDAELTPLIVAAARRVKRVLADEQNEALDALRQGDPVDDVAALLAAEDERVSRYVDAMTNELESATMAGAASVSGDPSPEVTRSGALGPVHELFAASLVTPLRDRVERAVADGDGDNDAVAKRVRAVYRDWKTTQVDEKLDDVFRLAYGRGALAVLPVGTPVRWIVDPAGPACPDAEDNALAGVVPAGDAFPTGHVCAPAHDKCRCLLEPADQ